MFRGKCYASSRLKSTKTTDIIIPILHFTNKKKNISTMKELKKGKSV